LIRAPPQSRIADVAKPKRLITVIERRELIRRPIAEVFAFLDRPTNLKRVFPSSLAVTLERHPVDLRPGTLFGYRLRRWPLDFEWDVVVSDYRPPERFTNVKARGYFPRWAMEHEILAREQDSELRMCLSYEVPAGLYSAFTHSYVIRDAMRELVEAQIRAIRDALEKEE
jgi:ligand-binding SRPBCC domain-containing protein